MIASVMAGPFFSQHLTAEAVLVVGSPEAVRVFGESAVSRDFESVRGCPQTDNWTTTNKVIDKVLHLLRRPVLEAGKHHHQVGNLQGFHPGHVRLSRLNHTTRIDTKQHSAPKSVVFRENSRQSGQRFLGPVFVIAGNEHDVLALAWTVSAGVDERIGLRDRTEKSQTEHGQQCRQSHRSLPV